MLARLRSFLLQGIDASVCEVEVDLDDAGLPKETTVGLPDAAVKESLSRVRAALSNSGYSFPRGRVLINLAPADVRKEGPVYDLPIAVTILAAQGVIRPAGSYAADVDRPPDLAKYLVAGELALDGRVRPVRGALALASLAKAAGAEGVIVPSENAAEAALVEGVRVLGVSTLGEAVGVLTGRVPPAATPTTDLEAVLRRAAVEIDFADVRGQEAVKRAIVVAAAGAHNLLLLGPAGTGKTMMARALPGVLPPMTPEEAIEVTRIYSAAGKLDGRGVVASRPVRTPHHTASAPAIVGGGIIPRPGEVSLAHHGVLFLDELAEFPRVVLETLRQPMEDRVVTVARVHSAVKYPAAFMLVAAMNPTPKGDVAPGEVGQRAMERYLSRISGPLLDRIDIHVEAPAVPWKELSAGPRGTGSVRMREEVERARERQIARQGSTPNARLTGRQLDAMAAIENGAIDFLGRAMGELGLSARAYDKIRRVGRSIADIAGRDVVTQADVSEAVGYRLLDRRV